LGYIPTDKNSTVYSRAVAYKGGKQIQEVTIDFSTDGEIHIACEIDKQGKNKLYPVQVSEIGRETIWTILQHFTVTDAKDSLDRELVLKQFQYDLHNWRNYHPSVV